MVSPSPPRISAATGTGTWYSTSGAATCGLKGQRRHSRPCKGLFEMAIAKVMVVDDSAVARQVISSVLSKERSINVIAAVADPLFAMQRMQRDWPDVIVLDVEMPRMDGITFLKKIMSERPTPVVICSSLTV